MGSATGASGRIRPYLTYGIQGAGGPRKSDSRFHPPISPEGLYWVTPVPSSGMTFNADGKTAILTMTNVPIIDQPRWPAMDAESIPAFMDFKLVLTATNDPVKYEDPAQQYRFDGFKASAQLEAAMRVPSINFTFKTDVLEASKCDFAVMGNEVHGKYYEAAKT